MRGKSDKIIHGLFSEIVALKKGWPLVRVATYRGTTVLGAYLGRGARVNFT